MVKAVWQGVTVAESDRTIVVEGNHYFPPGDVRKEVLVNSDHQTTCPWKGKASYYHVQADGKQNRDAAWTYHDPKSAARELGIQDYIAFWKDVRVEA